jgi:mRNA-degrading endonuclease RelE of RelBE toxin-antitoxin system
MNNMSNKVNKSLQIFTEQYDNLCKKFIDELEKNNIKKNQEDNFYYLQTETGKMKYTWINIKNK